MKKPVALLLAVLSLPACQSDDPFTESPAKDAGGPDQRMDGAALQDVATQLDLSAGPDIIGERDVVKTSDLAAPDVDGQRDVNILLDVATPLDGGMWVDLGSQQDIVAQVDLGLQQDVAVRVDLGAQMDVGRQVPRWQKLSETPSLQVKSTGYHTVFMGDRITFFTDPNGSVETWSYRFAQNDWRRVSKGPLVEDSYIDSPGTVWTGTRLFFWSGIIINGPQARGGLYDPTSDDWSAVSLDNAPPLVVWGGAYTGTEVFTYGATNEEFLNPGTGATGVFYNPTTDRWRNAPTHGAPTADHVAVVGLGGKIVVWGGYVKDEAGSLAAPFKLVGSGAVYDTATDGWTPIATQNAPSPRTEMIAFAAQGQAFFWGGTDWTWDSLGNRMVFRSGALYDPTHDLWTPASTAGAPVDAVGGLWADEQRLAYVWAGQDSPGARLWTYDPASDAWSALDISDLSALNQLSFYWTGADLLAMGFVQSQTTGDAPTSDLRLTGYRFVPGN